MTATGSCDVAAARGPHSPPPDVERPASGPVVTVDATERRLDHPHGRVQSGPESLTLANRDHLLGKVASPTAMTSNAQPRTYSTL
jgi:hypothetical protein